MTRVNHKNQQGIVLISCLVFLILILGLLRISLGSSQITEKKSGIDMDILSARESAESVMRSVINGLIPPADASRFPACAAGAEARLCRRARILAAKNEWKDKDLSSFSDGLFDGTQKYDACGGPGNPPLWQCVNWGSEFNKEYGVAKSLTPVSIGRNAYIIESFPPEKYGITGGIGTESILLRITALGIGQETPGGRPTNVMLQAEYLLQ